MRRIPSKQASTQNGAGEMNDKMSSNAPIVSGNEHSAKERQRQDAGESAAAAHASPSSPLPSNSDIKNALTRLVFSHRVGLYLSNQDLKPFAESSSGPGEASVIIHNDRRHLTFLQHVVCGRQDEAETILKQYQTKQDSQYDVQWLLQAQQTVTDYSGRTFKCSAYEYAFWAKDTHMCRMLETYMDEATKAVMLDRIDAIEQNGLMYKQNDVEIQGSKHVDLTKLLTTMQQYIDTCISPHTSTPAVKTAWREVGKAQREVPVHVINVLCNEHCVLDPCPLFNVEYYKLPRDIMVWNSRSECREPLFPLVISENEGLGVDCALYRDRNKNVVPSTIYDPPMSGAIKRDMEAIKHLDEVRTAELMQSRDNLKPKEPSSHFGMSP